MSVNENCDTVFHPLQTDPYALQRWFSQHEHQIVERMPFVFLDNSTSFGLKQQITITSSSTTSSSSSFSFVLPPQTPLITSSSTTSSASSFSFVLPAQTPSIHSIPISPHPTFLAPRIQQVLPSQAVLPSAVSPAEQKTESLLSREKDVDDEEDRPLKLHAAKQKPATSAATTTTTVGVAKTTSSPTLINNRMSKDVEWWFDSNIFLLRLPCVLLNNLPIRNEVSMQVQFQQKFIRGFRNFYHLQRLTDGSAVGNKRICSRVIQRNLPIPPFITKTQRKKSEDACLTKEALCSVFSKIWFVTNYEPWQKDVDEDNDEVLVCWPDLYAENQDKKEHLQAMVNRLFCHLTKDHARLLDFLLFVFGRVCSS